MKPSELEKLLKAKGARLKRHGSNHDIWENPLTGQETRIWRHAKEVPKGTCNAILKQLGLK